MKKLIAVLLVALLAIALVACGGDTTTPAPAGTSGNTPTSSSTPAATDPTESSGTPESSNTPESTNTPPVTESGTPDDPEDPIETAHDLAYPDEETLDSSYQCLGQMGNVFCQFENGFGLGDCLVIIVGECDAGVYQDLIWHDEGGSWRPNPSLEWKLIIDGVEYYVSQSQFSIYNTASDATSNWIRMGLGKDFKFNTEDVNENGEHGYVIRLEIREEGKLKYYADLSSSEDDLLGTGPYYFKPTDRTMVVDPDRAGVEVTGIEYITGPTSSAGEGAANLFDGDTSTKLCTSDEATAVEFKTSAPVTLTGISLVNANDNQDFSGRTIVAFTLYGSTDGSTWEVIHVEVPEEGFDKATVSQNYLERYYKITTDKAYTNFKFESQNGEMYQLSELLLWN